MSDDRTASPCRCQPSADTSAPAGSLPGKGPVQRSVFHIPGMDCPAEEQTIRLHLADAPVAALVFDLPGRTLVVHHGGPPGAILALLQPLGYGAELRESSALAADAPAPAAGDQGRVLRLLLAINALMFVVEAIAGWWAGSAGLVADAADMFADAAVYGVALYAVGRSAAHQRNAARLSGVLQFGLGLGALGQTGSRMLAGGLPVGEAMIGISLLALTANVACLLLVARHREGGAHMRASFIFSANDVLANLGVIAAGALVAWTASPWPDWIIGTAIGILVLAGAIRILKLRWYSVTKT